MTSTNETLPVSGTTRHDESGLLLVLEQHVEGHDTFLTGRLDLGEESVPVRIISFDDVTVLRPTKAVRPLASRWTGVLHLPHGARHRRIPADLTDAARERARDVAALDPAELRYALTFLGEATTDAIRTARIEAIVSALPQYHPEAA
nr:hypothetical protein OH826_34655 [Streptomyces sp. NBC_00899]